MLDTFKNIKLPRPHQPNVWIHHCIKLHRFLHNLFKTDSSPHASTKHFFQMLCLNSLTQKFCKMWYHIEVKQTRVKPNPNERALKLYCYSLNCSLNWKGLKSILSCIQPPRHCFLHSIYYY